MSQPDADFRHIPVEMAQQIGRDCHKDQVIVLSYDSSCGMLATATWGHTPEDKVAAARAGDSLTAVIGGDLSRSIVNADFRHVPAAEAARRIEALLLRLQEARRLIETMRGWFLGTTPPGRIVEWADAAQAWLATGKPPADEAARYDEHSPRVD